MQIEITYRFDINKYKQKFCEHENHNIFDGSKIFYEYVDKTGVACKVKICFKSATSQNLLGNNLFSTVIDMHELYAKIDFKSCDEYTNFTLPNWLSKFKYIN